MQYREGVIQLCLFLILRTGNSLKRLLWGSTEAFKVAEVSQYEEERKGRKETTFLI